MSQGVVQTLDDLQNSNEPAWLWDGARARIVWANGPGVRFFGCETLFDLIDRRFDSKESGIASVAALAGRLKPAETREEILTFSSAPSGEPILTRCIGHRLSDGRMGVLVVAAAAADVDSPAETVRTLGWLVDALPVPIVLTDASGHIVYATAEANSLIPSARRHRLSTLLGSAEAADALIERVRAVRTTSDIHRLDTNYGPRDLRIDARRLGAEADIANGILLVLDDVTERRALERSLRDNSERLEDLVAAAADFTFEIGADLTFRALSDGFKTLTGIAEDAWLQRSWSGIAEQHGLDPGGQVEAAMRAGKAWRSIVGCKTSSGIVQLGLSAVPITAADGSVAGFRGIGIRAVNLPGETSAPSKNSLGPREASTTKHVASALVTGRDDTAGENGSSRKTRSLDERDAQAFVEIGWQIANDDDTSAISLDIGGWREDEAYDSPARDDVVIATAKAIIDRMPDAMIVHRNGEIIAANEYAARLAGFANVEELVAQSSLDRIISDWPDETSATITLPDGTTRTVEAIRTPIEAPRGRIEQILLVGDDSPGGELEGSGDKAGHAPVATHDFTVSDDALRAILETATDGIITLERSGRIHTFNAGAQAIFDCDAESAIGRPIFEFLAPESRRIVKDYLSAMIDSNLASIFNDGREVTALERHGGEIPLFITLGRIERREGTEDTNGAPDLCCVIRDITQWKKSEAELRAAKEAAERASAQKSEFLANVSHELRTPLNAILGFSEMMRSERFGPIRNEKYKSYVNDIYNSGEHLLSLINDLLDLSKVEAGKMDLNFTAVDLGNLLEQCVQIMHEQARERGVVVRTSIAKDAPLVVADQRSMRQIILNLLSNAIKFTGPGGQVIASLFLSPEGEIKLTCRDTGIGMSESELSEALEPFKRLETKKIREEPGTGLGLPLTRALATANRADFSISSVPDEGTLIEITFPTTRVLAG